MKCACKCHTQSKRRDDPTCLACTKCFVHHDITLRQWKNHLEGSDGRLTVRISQ